MLFRSRSHALALRSRLARASALLCLCALVVSSTGCFGTFPLTRTIYRENQEVSDVEFHQTLAYWAMVLTLVYPGAILSDMIVMNTIEFWKAEPAGWEASQAFIPVPDNRFESAEIGPGLSTSALAMEPVDSVLDDVTTPFAPVLDAPGVMAPSRPAVPLPLPPLSPVFEEFETSTPSITLSRSDGPGMAY